MNSNASYRASRFFHWMIVICVGLVWLSCAEVFDLPRSTSGPRIIGISPDSGATGMRVFISGRNFSKTLNENAVKFNGTDAVVAAALDTQLVALVPAHAGTGTIQVTVGKLAIEGPVFTFFETPIVDRISPLEGKPGTVVTVYGKYFDNNATNNIVRFGGKIGTVIPPARDSLLTVSVPSDAQTGPVTVTVHGIEGIGPRFVVLPSTNPVHSITGITPTSGQAGTVVTVTGVNFNPTPANNIVQFNGLAGTVTNATATTLTVVAPTGGTTGLVSVTIDNITANGSTFTYVDNTPVPTITNYDPNQGYVGDVVAIVGTNFSAVSTGNAVKFNGVSAIVSQASATLLKVTVPPGATTGPITVTVGTKTATGTTFTVLDNSPTITGFTPTSGPVGTPVIITGTNFGTDPAAALIMFNGVLASTQQITPTSLITVVPVGATTGKITVTVNGKTGTSNSDFIITAASANSWTATTPMNDARDGHTATLLPDGKVLVVGGTKRLADGTNTTLGSCELYDTSTENWTATGALNTGNVRSYHTATLLPNGKVLVTGGFVENTQTILASSALYDPATGQWSSTGALTEKRFYHTATLLNTGKVLVSGGNGSLATCELYDPNTGQWSAAGSLSIYHSQHTATLLNNGNVLVAGGAQGNGASATCELYNPTNDTWSLAAPMPQGHGQHTAVLLPSGITLVIGGVGFQASGYLIYDPANQWADRGNAFYQRIQHTSTLLPSGNVLTAGGQPLGTQFSGATNAAELYNTATSTATLAAGMISARGYHTATLLPNGKVLVTGGFRNGPQGYGVSASDCELYTP